MKLADVKLGDTLMLFLNGKSIGGCTNHTLSLSPSYSEIATKDSGITPWKKLTKVDWTISCEALWIADEYKSLMDNILADTEFDVIFGTSNWSEEGLGNAESWTPVAGMLYKGKVKINSLTLNAAAGDNASYTCEFTGTSALTEHSL